MFAAQRFGYEPSRAGFARATGACEQVTVSDSSALDAVLKGPNDVLLSDQVGKGLASIFAIERDVSQVV
jgi:hypothetical protein